MEVPEQIREWVNASLDASAVVDPELRLLHYNARYAELLGVQPRRLRSAGTRGMCHTVLGLESCQNGRCLALRALEVGRRLRLDEILGPRRRSPAIVSATPVIVAGALPLVIETYRDVTAESQMQTKYLALLRSAREVAEHLKSELSQTRAQLAESSASSRAWWRPARR